MAESFDQLASIVGERDAASSLPLFRRARDVFEALPASFRDSAYASQFERYGLCAMAVSLAHVGRRGEALQVAERGIAVADRVAQMPNASVEDRLGPSMCRFQAARARRALGDKEEAVRLLDGVSAALEQLLAKQAANVVPYVGLTQARELVGALVPSRRCEELEKAAAVWSSWPGAPTPYLQGRREQLDAAVAACRVDP